MNDLTAVFWALGLLSTLVIGVLWLVVKTPMNVANQVKAALSEMRAERQECQKAEEKRVDEKLEAAEKLNLEGYTNLHHRIDDVKKSVDDVKQRVQCLEQRPEVVR